MLVPKEEDRSFRFVWKNRKKTKTFEEAADVIRQTGRMPRPLAARDVQSKTMTKNIVANKEELKEAAKFAACYSVQKLQARLLLKRERHPVWEHDRVMVYGKIYTEYIQACQETSVPIEERWSRTFKAAFREDVDPFLHTAQAAFDNEMDRRDVKPHFVKGSKKEKALKAMLQEDEETDENIFYECIFDNVLDLGELVLQQWRMGVDPFNECAKARKIAKRKMQRLSRRFSKEFGQSITLEQDAAEDLRNPEAL